MKTVIVDAQLVACYATMGWKVPEEKPFVEKDRRWLDYIESGCWKCDKSPTGAHHWKTDGYHGTCKYCGVEKEVLPSWPTAAGWRLKK